MCAMCVKEGKLFGIASWRESDWVEIRPDDIVSVSERLWPMPALRVRTGDRTGGDATLLRIEGVGHGFEGAHRETMWAAAAPFFEKHLRGK